MQTLVERDRVRVRARRRREWERGRKKEKQESARAPGRDEMRDIFMNLECCIQDDQRMEKASVEDETAAEGEC